MLDRASRFFSFSGAAVLAALLFAAPASPQLLQPEAILSGDQLSDFGASLAVSGGTIAVGAPEDGFAEVFDRNQGGVGHWGSVTKVYREGIVPVPGFGEDVGLSGDTLVVGRALPPWASSLDLGGAFIFERNAGGANAWGRVKQLIPSDLTDFRLFGFSVAVSGDTVAVGVGSPITFPSFPPPQTGSVYIFERNRGGAGQWGEVRRVPLPSLMAPSLSVELDGDTLAVGVKSMETVYVFERHQGGMDQWGQVRTLTASDAGSGHRFGSSLGISGDSLVVGAPGARAAYVFERGQGTWSEAQKLVAPGAPSEFGSAVAIDGDAVLTGASTTGPIPSPAIGYLFRRNLGGPGVWAEAARLGMGMRPYISSIGLSGDVAVLGDPSWSELTGPEVHVFGVAGFIPGDIPTLGPFGLAAMALLLLAAGWWISARRRLGLTPRGSR